MSLLTEVSNYAEQVRQSTRRTADDSLTFKDSFLIACELVKIEDYRRANVLTKQNIPTALEHIAISLEEIKNK